MKKKILIWMTAMQLGGAERSLIGLLNSFDYSKVDVDLFLNQHQGELMKDIPAEVNLLPEVSRYASITAPIKKVLKNGHFLIAMSRLFSKIMVKAFYPKGSSLAGTTTYSHRFTKWLMPKIKKNTTYDLAISYITPHYFVTEKVKAKKKIAWIHQDYRKGVFDHREHLKMWSKYDGVVSISESVKTGFVECFPTLKDKIIPIENFIPVELIRRDAEEQIELPYKEGKTNILSIGRFCWEKNFTAVPAIMQKLLTLGVDAYWYIIGFGGQEKEIKNAIEKANLQDRIILLGKKANPYPYIKNCSLYVQPSISEGKAVTVTEAQILGKPVVITDYPTARSQLTDGFDGVIVPINADECAKGIAKVLKDKEIVNTLAENCKKTDYSGKKYISILLNE